MNEEKKINIVDVKVAIANNEMKAFVKNSKTGTHILLKDNASGETIQIGFVPKKVRWG